MDLSFNNVSHISRAFFRPAELSLTHLRLAYNQLRNVTWDVFGSMPHLQWLDLRSNRLREVGWDAFRDTKRMQVLLLAGNELEQLHADTFRTLQQLRVVDLSDNLLRNLPDGLFFSDGLEKLEIRNNALGRAPLSALSYGAAGTLHDLDLSGNQIASLPNGEMLGRFRSLRTLDLSHNRLLQLEEGVFSPLIRLTELDLSHNSDIRTEPDLRALAGIEDQLDDLRLDNTSLSGLRQMPLSNLKKLSVADNSLPGIPPELLVNMSRLRDFDLSGNDLTSIPVLISKLPVLRRLSLARNPLTQIGNASLPERLAELDLRSLPRLEHVDDDAICGEFNGDDIRILKCGAWPHLAIHIDGCDGLRELEVHVNSQDDKLDQALDGSMSLPVKLRGMTFSGRALKEIKSKSLRGLLSHTLTLRLYNTSVSKIEHAIFEQLDDSVRDIKVDIGHENTELRDLSNPNTASRPGLPRKVFLSELKLAGHPRTCTCDLGWIETWLRKRRQYMCETEEDERNEDGEITNLMEDPCDPVGDDLREATCGNKNNASLLEILKTDIECGWSKAAPTTRVVEYLTTLSMVVGILRHLYV